MDRDSGRTLHRSVALAALASIVLVVGLLLVFRGRQGATPAVETSAEVATVALPRSAPSPAPLPEISIEPAANPLPMEEARPEAPPGDDGKCLVEGRAYLRDVMHPLRSGELRVTFATASGSAWSGLEYAPAILTDEEGRFRVGGLEEGALILSFFHEGFQSPQQDVVTKRGDAAPALEVIFRDGITVTGVVRSTSGELLPGLRLKWGEPGRHESTRQVADVDEAGRYEVHGLKSGLQNVWADGAAADEDRLREVTLGEEPRQEVPLTFGCPPALEVRVIATDGAPAARAEVRYSYSVPGRSGTTTAEPTDDDGVTWIQCLPAGVTIQLEAGSEPIGTARLDHVVNPRGGKVTLHGKESRPFGFRGGTDAGGRLHVPRLPTGTYTIKAKSADGRFGLFDDWQWRGEPATVELQLKPLRR